VLVVRFQLLRKLVSGKRLFGKSRGWVLLAALLLLFFLIVQPLAQAEQTDAASAIASAEQRIVTCYQAAMDTEAAGANISSLTPVLNDAGALLSRAELAYSMNDSDLARDLAVQSQAKLGGFLSEANSLETSAVQQRHWDFWVYMFGSIVGALAVVICAVAVWVFLKRRSELVGAHVDESSGV
jgi:cobalamin biosynthesis Mg chelatase CobN